MFYFRDLIWKYTDLAVIRCLPWTFETRLLWIPASTWTFFFRLLMLKVKLSWTFIYNSISTRTPSWSIMNVKNVLKIFLLPFFLVKLCICSWAPSAECPNRRNKSQTFCKPFLPEGFLTHCDRLKWIKLLRQTTNKNSGLNPAFHGSWTTKLNNCFPGCFMIYGRHGNHPQFLCRLSCI